MTTINPNSVNDNKNFKQDDGGWSSMYLPAICAAVLVAGVLFFAVNWSKKPQTTAKINSPIQQQASATVPNSPAASVPEKPKKALKKHHRPPTAKYVNSDYGVSFNYPVKYTLQSGDKLTTLPATYLKEGAVAVAAVDMPEDSYPETDFTAALLNVSVSNDMTSDECMQFNQPSTEASDVKPTIVKLGANEYSVFEQINGESDNKSDLKYFHLFRNNACYEFALAVNTTEQEDTAQVEHGKVFQQLEKVLTTARIKDLQPTEVQNADRTPSTGLPIAESNPADGKASDAKPADTKPSDAKAADVKSTDKTENAQVVTPEQKPEQK